MSLGTGQGGYGKMGRDYVFLDGDHEMETSTRPSTAPRILQKASELLTGPLLSPLGMSLERYNTDALGHK